MRQMRVVFATNFFPPAHEGGTETYTLGLARHLRALGHESFVVCAENWGSGKSWKPSYRDTTYDQLPVRRLCWNWQLAPDPFRYLYDNPAIQQHLEQYFRELRPDVVHVTSCYSLGVGTLRAAVRAGVPVVLTLTDFWFISPRQTLVRPDGSLCTGPESPLICAQCLAGDSTMYRRLTSVLPADVVGRGLARLSHVPGVARQRGFRGYLGDVQARAAVLRRAFDTLEAAIAPSRALRDVFVHNGYPADRLIVSGYGLDLGWVEHVRPRPPDGRVRFAYIGQIEPIKGIDVLVSAFRSLGDSRADLKLFGGLAKNPPFAERLRALASGAPSIQFMGPFDRTQVAEVFSQIDCVVVPSIWFENAPVVIAEAFAANKPVICTDLGGMTDLVRHEINGLVFGLGDTHALATCLRRVIDEPGLLERLRAGIEPVRSVEQEATWLVQLYQDCIASRRAYKNRA